MPAGIKVFRVQRAEFRIRELKSLPEH